jgi:tRNA(adenine34) deaminase
MSLALTESQKAFDKGEVPIGCVVVCDDKIIAQAHNTCETDQDALAHAELKAIREASRVKGNWRLNDCTLYVTLEPCPMCLGALFQARVGRLVFGCYDDKRRNEAPRPTCGERGIFPSLHGSTVLTDNNHTIEIIGGVMEEECAEILKSFFKLRRGTACRAFMEK